MNLEPISVDAEYCRGCDLCVLACSLYHTSQCNPSLARLYVTRESDHYAFTPNVCLHCTDPACMAACPFEAIELDEIGIAYIIQDRCDACGLCKEACPYDAIFYHQEISLYLKCDLCRERKEGPVCVEVCPTGALSLTYIKEEEG